MKFYAAVALFAAAGVSAQSPTVGAGVQPTSECSAENIVSKCLETLGDSPKDCKTQDYQCLCDAYKNIYTCFNNCPHDSRAPATKADIDSYCNAASLVAPKSTTSSKSSSSSSSKSSSAVSTTTAISSTAASTPSASKTSSSASVASSSLVSITKPVAQPTTASPTKLGPPTTRASASVTTAVPAANGAVGVTINGGLAALGMAVVAML